MTKRRATVAVALVMLIMVGVAAAVIGGVFSGPAPLTPAQVAARAAQRLLKKEQKIVKTAAAQLSVALPTTEGSPAPSIPTVLFKAPIGVHQVVGFLPYWLLGSTTAAELDDVSTVAYFALDVTATGTLVETGPGWSALLSARFGELVSEAHAKGDSVLLTVMSANNATIHSIVAHAASTSQTLASSLATLVAQDHLDGVDIDLEGSRATDRRGFVAFMKQFTLKFRAADPTGAIVLDTYPGSASSPHDFFDVAHLAPLVDELFVMAYDMDQPQMASSNDPVYSPTLGISDVSSLLSYIEVVAPAKIIFGLPFYGFDFSTASSMPGAAATKPYPEAVVYSSIVEAAHVAKWDPASGGPFATFKRGGTWHQTWYDDPLSIALRVALAEQFHVAGVGAWALGMESADGSMLQALGGASPIDRGSALSPKS